MMNELHLVELGKYGVLLDVDHVNTLVTLDALEKEKNRLAEGEFKIIRRHNVDELVVAFDDYKHFVHQRANALSK